ncbi:dihydrofolate reductase family protein [Histidinibacterium aquaticum]|uniref:Dihydrofolate reductase n=1 Tax=Histidinibacterium aquaticum TaxID=2613962 RepID=A0A5J5GRU7_9RHOB|nr:dihydrofolate reductase family protein [Histidinibacterium aquaticum]KAA9010393.1 dihydrofolate reductase [Histidinibacterium aquaticum]
MVSGHVFIATSLDGFIARPDGALDWLEVEGATEDHGYDAFMARMDGLVMGRATYETVLGFGDWPYSKPVVVLSRSLTPADLPASLVDRVRISAAAPREVMAELATEGWARAYVDGGRVIQSFLREGLISEIVITRIPVLLGAGLPLFGALDHDIPLRHAETRSFAGGLVQSRYDLP